jgi:uncharacterized protein YutE (UPF0331/DUF86 family)
MVLDRGAVERRLQELDEVLGALEAQEPGGVVARELQGDLSRRWRLERGLLAACNLLLDIAAHIASAHFSTHPATYEETFQGLARRGVLRPDTGDALRGLGGFRNVLAHEYLDIDLEELVRWRSEILAQGSPVIAQVQGWLDKVGA